MKGIETDVKHAGENGYGDREEYAFQAAIRATEAFPYQLETYRKIIEIAPGLAEPEHRRLLCHALHSDYLHHNEDKAKRLFERVAIPSGTLSSLEGKEVEHRHKKYKGLRFLEAHRDALPGFAWTGWQPGQWPRQIDSDGLSDEIRDLLREDLRGPVLDLSDPFDLHSGDRVHSPYRGPGLELRKGVRKRAREEAEKRRGAALCDEQGLAIDVLNAVPPRVLEKIVKGNVQWALEAALRLEIPSRTVSRLRHDLRAAMDIRRLQYQPHAFYGPSRKRRTVRLFPTSFPSVAGVWRDVRKALLAGCVECDLKNLHLAIAGRLWEVPSILDLLEREGSAWPYLLGLLQGHHDATPGEAKEAIKRAVYSTVYGMSEQGVRHRLGLDLTYRASASFINAPLVQDLFIKRGKALGEIEVAKGARDRFGVWYPVQKGEGEDDEKGCRSVLASVMQAEELGLLMPVIEDAQRVQAYPHPQYHLVAWQHDGFAFKARYNPEGVAHRLSLAVQSEADRLGYPTSLEVETL